MKQRKPILGEPAADRGAALLLVLVLVTVIALAGAALLVFSDTSIRATVALRDQAATAYAADGAGQVAIDNLVHGTYPDNCFSAGDPLTLGTGTTAFYTPRAGTTSLNAYISCTPDTATGTGVVVGPDNTPADALFTVGDDTALDVPGQDFGRKSANKTVAVSNGNVISKSSIDTGKNTLAVTGAGVTVLASSQSNCIGDFAPTPCKTGALPVAIPTYPAPKDPVSPAPEPVCSKTYAAFRPGLYTSVADLNGPCGTKSVVWFSPGTYYFDFPDSWAAPARLVGGTPTDSSGKPITGLDPADAATLSKLSALNPSSPGACADPSKQVAPGVEFVFGGVSRIDLGKGQFEICASYVDAKTVPIAIYGPTTPIPVQGGKATAPVSTETVCKEDDCSLFQNSNDGQAAFNIMGLTYAPNARMYLKMKNSDGQNFNWGLVLRSLAIEVNGASPKGPVVQIPADGNGGTTSYSIKYVNVWVCPISGTACAHSGTPQLRAKVQVTGAPATAKVLSWSVQR